jgi:hypothetical protein
VIFCPSPVDIFDHINGKSENSRSIEAHLKRCKRCQEVANEIQGIPEAPNMPRRVKRAFDTRFKGESTGIAPVDSSPSGIDNIVSIVQSFFRIPTLALVSAAAAIFAFAIIYPFTQDSLYPAFSGIRWEDPNQRFRIMGARPKTIWPKAAIIIVYKDFKAPPSQEEIDSLYESIRPSAKLRKQLTILDPSDVKKAIEASRINPSNIEEIVKLLTDKLSLKKALIVDISPEGDTYKIMAYVMDPSMKKGASSTSKAMSSSDLDRAVKEALNELDLNQD